MQDKKQFNGFSSQAAYDKAMSIAKDAEQYFPKKNEHTLAVYKSDNGVDVWIGDYEFNVTFDSTYGAWVHVAHYDRDGGCDSVMACGDDEIRKSQECVPIFIKSAALLLQDSGIWQDAV